ncbi:MAG: hypothetical protein PHE54_04580 [Bacilli bacterium]|nr:hypothetical protein [Bacilli bacterium]
MNDKKLLKNVIDEQLKTLNLMGKMNNVSARNIDNLMHEITGNLLRLDELYEEEIATLEDFEVHSVEEELTIVQRIIEISKNREEMLTKSFDLDDKKQKFLADLFSDMAIETAQKGADYEVTAKQLEAEITLKNDFQDDTDDLHDKQKQLSKQISEIKASIIPCNQFDERLIQDYEQLLDNYKIKDLTDGEIANLKEEQTLRTSWQTSILKNIELSSNLNANLNSEFEEVLTSNSHALRDANDKLFLLDLSKIVKIKALSYQELSTKMQEMYNVVASYEESSSTYLYPSLALKQQYFTNLFEKEAEEIIKQTKLSDKVADLEKQKQEVETEIREKETNPRFAETLTYLPLQSKARIATNEDIGMTADFKDITLGTGVVEGTAKLVLSDVAKETALSNLNLPPDVALIPDFEVVQKRKAPSKLLEKVKKYKKQLMSIGKKAAAIILAGAILFTAGDNFIKKTTTNEMTSQDVMQASVDNTLTGHQYVINQSDGTKVTIEKNQEDVKEVSPTVGDTVKITKGVKYYRDASSAILEKNIYEVGKNTLREGNYFVNRVALMTKDGNLIRLDTTKGVSSEELAKQLGLKKDEYEVVIHIGSGDQDGNFIEAKLGETSPDDVCWIKTGGAYNKGLILQKQVTNNLEGGKVR